MHPKSLPPRIIKSNEDFVIVRLSTGESLLGIRLSENDKDITVEFPFSLKNYPRITREGGIIEQITAGPYCSFAEDRKFILPKKDIFFIKKLHSFAVPFFMSLYNQHERLVSTGQIGKGFDNFLNKQELADLRQDEQFSETNDEYEYSSEYDKHTDEMSPEEVEEIREMFNLVKNKSKKTVH
jgi:hypothetical protein